ncbi:MAG: hypothetical protein Q7K42_03380, partial [Candidatus Diapherotrites archaeon]|nr:hypothetical protein [Candidatus Diapherotrites archaeon]
PIQPFRFADSTSTGKSQRVHYMNKHSHGYKKEQVLKFCFSCGIDKGKIKVVSYCLPKHSNRPVGLCLKCFKHRLELHDLLDYFLSSEKAFQHHLTVLQKMEEA